MSNNLHHYLVTLAHKVNNEPMDDATLALVRSTLDGMREWVAGDHKAMRETALQSLVYVLDVAVNQGTVEDMWELRELLENTGSSYAAQPNNETSMRLMGELWNQSFNPGEFLSGSPAAPLDDIHDTWCALIGAAAQNAFMAYVENVWEEEEEED